MTDTLELDQLRVVAGRTLLLDGVSLSVAAGRIVAVVGSNGAGKTTLLDAVCGLMPTSGGTVAIVGATASYAPGRCPDPQIIGRAFQGSPLPATLSVGQVALTVARNRHDADALLGRFGLRGHEWSFVSELSTGMRRILDLAVASVHQPDLLLLDEPASGLSASEVDHLAELILRWRDETGAAVLLVEHDTSLVDKVADEVVVLDAGAVVAKGSPVDVLHRRPPTPPRLTDPGREGFADALRHVTDVAAPAAPPLRRTLSTWTHLRLGLVPFSTGLAATLILGVLNRVLKVEFGVSLALVAPILASYNLAAPLSLYVGHLSDTRPILGRRRAPYIIAGSLVSALSLMAAPHLTKGLAGGVSVLLVVAAFSLFVALGLGLYGSQTVFFALLTDLVDEHERGASAALAYVMLMSGVLFGVALAASILDADAGGLTTLFTVGGLTVVGLTTLAVWGAEDRASPKLAETVAVPIFEPSGFLVALRSVAVLRQARMFFIFLLGATVFTLFHRAVLEPYGGDVLGLEVRATAAFNAVFTVGFLLGTLIAGRGLADRIGHRRIASIGLVAAASSFLALAAAAATAAEPPSWLAIFAVGLSIGFFNVGALSLMMGMIRAGRAALFLGAWSTAHALADGIGTAGGGFMFEGVSRIIGSLPLGYASVFALQAVGLLLCLPLLRSVDPNRFSETDETHGDVP